MEMAKSNNVNVKKQRLILQIQKEYQMFMILNKEEMRRKVFEFFCHIKLPQLWVQVPYNI